MSKMDSLEEDDAIEEIRQLRHLHGSDDLIERIKEGSKLSDFSERRLECITEVLTEDKILQLLGANTPLRLTLNITPVYYQDSELRERKEEIEKKLRELRKGEYIADFLNSGVQSPITIPDPSDGLDLNRHLYEEYIQYRIWAHRESVMLEPWFEQKASDRLISYPDIFLVAYWEENLVGVFPCADGKRTYSIEDYLSAIEREEDWREWQGTGPSLTTPDFSKHGAIKAQIKQNPKEILGDEWNKSLDEVEVGNNLVSEDAGRIDLVFKQESAERYLLVEVKSVKSEVDKAIGQVNRYKYLFAADRGIPNLTTEHIKVAIAAPDFLESHKKVAREFNIRLIEIP